MEHSFTNTIKEVLQLSFGDASSEIYKQSELLQYVNLKTRSANKGAKSRSSYGSLYAVYVIIEDYINKGFNKKGGYADSDGAVFSDLFKRQRELPFGAKLQNHALNNRVNSEFKKYFPLSDMVPILRNVTNHYWINENLLKCDVGNGVINFAEEIIAIIDRYTYMKQDAFQRFVLTCRELISIPDTDDEKVIEFINGLLAPNMDARLFEIASYSILKFHYANIRFYWGYESERLHEDFLALYKTGRTNANDGGIDFVMRPVGRFFQVTETLDFKKYFLDIDKVQKFPITFIVKSEMDEADILLKIETYALKTYSVSNIVSGFMACIEEIINVPKLMAIFSALALQGRSAEVLKEIITQSEVEFNYADSDFISD